MSDRPVPRIKAARPVLRAWFATLLLAAVVTAVAPATVSAALVAAPGPVGAEFVPGNKVRLSWVGSLPVGGGASSGSYTIWRGATVIGEVPANPTTTANAFTTGVLPKGLYWFQVQAVDNAGTTSVKTSPVKVVVWEGDTTAPHAVRGFTVNDGYVDEDVVQLVWNGAFDDLAVKSYTILDQGVVIKDAIPDSRNMSTTLHLPGGRHWLQIRAVDYAGNSSPRSAPVVVDITNPVIELSVNFSTSTFCPGLTCNYTFPTGTVTSDVGGINCVLMEDFAGTPQGDCAAQIPAGAPVTLHAEPGPISAFVGWSGPCASAGVGDCTVTPEESLQVVASFQDNHLVVWSVTRGATESELCCPFATISVTAGSATFNCGSYPSGITGGDYRGCVNHSFASGTLVTAVAHPVPGDTFTGWTTGFFPNTTFPGCATGLTCTFLLQRGTLIQGTFQR